MKEENPKKRPRGRPKSAKKISPKESKPRGRPQKTIVRIPPLNLAPGQARRFAEARDLSGYSYYELSKCSGIQASVIQRLEEGKLLRGATTYTISQLAQVLEEDPGWLAFGTGKSLLAEKAKKKET